MGEYNTTSDKQLENNLSFPLYKKAYLLYSTSDISLLDKIPLHNKLI